MGSRAPPPEGEPDGFRHPRAVHWWRPNPHARSEWTASCCSTATGSSTAGYFALINQPLTTSRGELVTAVFGFTNIVLRAIQDAKPDLVAVAFDLPKPTFRHDRYAEYKATRTRMPDDMRDQIPKVREVVKALGIPVYEQEGFEADDAIATLAGQAEAAGFEVVILTGDLDMLQLVSERTTLMVSLRGGIANTVSYDLAKIEDRWGLRPDQMLDYKALKGDTTDNIPGIPGVGEKTASTLVATWGTLDELYLHLDEVTPEKLRPLLDGAPRPGAREPRADAARARRRPPVRPVARRGGGLRPRDGRAPVPRVRVPDADRPPAAARRRATRGRDRGDARAARRRVPGGAGRGRGAGRYAPGGPGAAPGTRGAGGQLQLSLDFDVVSGRRTADADAPAEDGADGHAARPKRRAEAVAVAAGDLPGALAAAIEDPGRIEVVDADGVAGLDRVDPRPGGRGHRASSSTTRARSPARSRRSPSPAPTAGWSRRRATRRRSRCGGCSRTSGCRSSGTTSSRC